MLDDMTVRGLRAQIKSGYFGLERMTKEEIEDLENACWYILECIKEFKESEK